MTGEQLRAARAMLRMDQSALAKKSGVSVETVKRLERADGDLSGTRVATITALQRALEAAGVDFIAENGGGAGVRLAKPKGAAEPTPQQPAEGEQGIIKSNKM